MTRRLLIVSASRRVVGSVSEKMQAIDRYDGLLMRVLRKHVRESRIDARDVLIVSPSLGLVRALDMVPYRAPIQGTWRNFRLDVSSLREMNESALRLLESLTQSSKYSEVYVNVGKKLYPILAGMEKVVHCRILYASGSGMGPKAAHMRDWLLSKSEAT
jgi:hypothetical protein